MCTVCLGENWVHTLLERSQHETTVGHLTTFTSTPLYEEVSHHCYYMKRLRSLSHIIASARGGITMNTFDFTSSLLGDIIDHRHCISGWWLQPWHRSRLLWHHQWCRAKEHYSLNNWYINFIFRHKTWEHGRIYHINTHATSPPKNCDISSFTKRF